MKEKKSILSVLILLMLVIPVFVASFVNNNGIYAADTKILNVIGNREGNETYKITNLDPQKTIWKIVSYDSMDDNATPNYDEAIYCITPEQGFGSETTAAPGKKQYDVSFDMSDLSKIEEKYKTLFGDPKKIEEFNTKYNSLLWILDNIYLPKQLPESERIKFKETLFKNAKIENSKLTDNDIEAVQQLALWYFTSSSEKYHFEPENFPSISINDKSIQEIGRPLNTEGQLRYIDMKLLYTYFITSAKANAASYGTADVRPVKSNITAWTNSKNYATEQLVVIVTRESVKEFDLALRKFITKIGDENITTRIPQVNADDLKSGKSTDAKYDHPKDPLLVQTGDLVTYTIRIYNEGQVDGYAEEITDNIPEGLKFVENNPTNIEYKWKLSEDGKKITTDYLSKANGINNLIKAFDKDLMTEPLFKDVKVVFEVIEPNTSDRTLTNIAEISDDADADGNEVNDIDSEPGNNKDGEDDIDVEHVVLQCFDLALRKFITAIEDEKITSREPKVDVTGLKEGTSTTATYTHPKDPLAVQTGNKVTYTIRVYNEGKVDGYAEEITDNIPEGLKFLVDNPTNIEYMWKLSEDGKKITTNYLSKKVDEENILKGFDSNTMETLDYKDVKVVFEVIEPNSSDRILTNIAEISDDADSDGNEIDDIDSEPGNDQTGEDDIDEEHLKLSHFDLSLRKFITKLNNKNVSPSREPKVDVTGLKNGTSTTAVYKHSKTPVGVQTGDIVTYTIRVYNEGKIDGYAEEITDYIPKGLEFVKPSNSTINSKYQWKVSEDGKKITTTYLSEAKSNKESTSKEENFLIKAFDKKAENPQLDYRDVQVEFKVIAANSTEGVLRNIAEISNDSNKDDDSDPNNVKTDKYTPPEDNSKYQEDDDDYEDLVMKYFDLSLRKFITKINEEDITTRIPQVSVGEDGKLTYTHPKDPILVANNDIVVYTIRVYNEGKIDGYASEITDDVPSELSYLPEHEINKKYRWELSQDAKTVSTDYLSRENSKDNLIKAFDASKEIVDEEGNRNPDYKEVQIAFKVTEKNLATDRVIINTAEITNDSDEDGNDIKDEDSTPDNGVEEEDDLDKEYIKVKYFDLSLLKWVSEVYVTENGKTTTTKTGHTGLEQPEPIVKVDLDRRKINKVTVKFGYVIKITNEGQIAGYATEISDYIPKGLKFIAEDNPDWEEVDGKIITTKLADKLLQPGESATVTVILTWINDSSNMGVMTNIAEISQDDNENDAEDIDSTPNNKKDGEDDIDDAPVMLVVKTGSAPKYIILITVILTMLGTGIFLIKKYVLD